MLPILFFSLTFSLFLTNLLIHLLVLKTASLTSSQGYKERTVPSNLAGSRLNLPPASGNGTFENNNSCNFIK